MATVQLASIRSYPERMKPPRALYCEFPLGRPLGKPSDAAFQRRVLETALALLDGGPVPVLEDFPDKIDDGAGEPLACALPPRHDASVPPAVDEARGLRLAYDRQRAATGRTNVGHVTSADGVPRMLASLVRVAGGTPLEEAELPPDLRGVGLDVRAYYEEAATALAGHVPAARQAESWLFQRTEAGKVLKEAQGTLREAGTPRSVWAFLVPSTQQDSSGRS